MYKRIENNSKNNRQYLSISRRGPIHACAVDAVCGEKMACGSPEKSETHTFTFDEAFDHLQEASLEDYIYLCCNMTNGDSSSFCEIKVFFENN